MYMTLQVAPSVGLVEGTEEDYHKVLADIEEQMKDGITEVGDYDGRWHSFHVHFRFRNMIRLPRRHSSWFH